MKKKILTIAVAALSLTALASCDNKNNEEKPNDTDMVDEIIKGFKTELENQSVSGTFKNNYEITVDAHGGNSDFSSFRHEIESKVDFEYTLGDDFYLYTKKTWVDKLDIKSQTTTETLLYKVDGKYMYSTTYTDPVEVEGMTKAKLDEYLQSVTAEQAGGISLSSFVYSKGQYELDNFGLTTTFAIDELAESKYEVNSSNGLNVTYNPDYVGYKTDNGMSDFGPASGQTSAADITITTDNNGYVTGWKELYHAGLDFQIMTPAPTVGITGSRELEVTYNTTITPKTADIEHKTPVAKVTINTPQNGTLAVQSLILEGQNPKDMKNVESLDRVEKGRYLLIKPTANEGYEVDSVIVNGEEVTKSAFGYAYLITDSKDIKVSAIFKEEGTTPDTPVVPELLGSYEGTSGNTVIDVNVYKDGTFTVTCPGYGGAKAGNGTYTKNGSVLTLTSTNMQYFVVTNTTVEMTLASDFQTLTTNAFFNGDAITFTLKK